MRNKFDESRAAPTLGRSIGLRARTASDAYLHPQLTNAQESPSSSPSSPVPSLRFSLLASRYFRSCLRVTYIDRTKRAINYTIPLALSLVLLTTIVARPHPSA